MLEKCINTLMERNLEMDVKIYTCISYGGMQKKESLYGACIVYVTPKGKIEARYYYDTCGSSIGFNQVMLSALVCAMQHLTKPCSITAYVKTEYIENMLNRGLPAQWERDNWKNSKGEQVACAKQWSELLRMTGIHELNFESSNLVTDNEYIVQMEKQLKEMRKDR